MSLESFLQEPMGMVALGAAGLIIGLALMRKIMQRRNRYELTELDEVVEEPMYKAIEKNGNPVVKRLQKHHAEIGVVRRAIKGDGELKAIVRKSSETSKIKDRIYWLRSRIKPIRHRFEDVYVISRDNYRIDPTRIVVKGSVGFKELGGVYMDNGTDAWNAVDEFVALEVLHDVLTRSVNWVKYLNWLDRRPGQAMQAEEHRTMLERAGFGGGDDAAAPGLPNLERPSEE